MQDARGDPRAPDGLIRPVTPPAARHGPSDGVDRESEAARTGRFAPSPTGDLHAGSLVAALASRCDAPSWRVRIDDIDPPREIPGSGDRILAALRAHGFQGIDDTSAERQSDHASRHRRALDALCAGGHLFACGCSRRELGAAAGCVGPCRRTPLGPDALEALFDAHADPRARPGTHRRRDDPAVSTVAVRARLGGSLEIRDRVLGRHRTDLDREAPDVVVLRRDGLFAYHLATAVDDVHGIDDVVRGADLFAATAVQVALMDRMDRAAPRYAHLPVALDASGAKLSKSSGAAALDPVDAARSLHAAWGFLGQRALGIDDDGPEAVARFWSLATVRWRLGDVPAVRARPWSAWR